MRGFDWPSAVLILLPWAAVVLGWILVCTCSPAGSALRQGLSVLRRYPRMIGICFLFTLGWRLWREGMSLHLRYLDGSSAGELGDHLPGHSSDGVVQGFSDLWTGLWAWNPVPFATAAMPVLEKSLLDLGGLFHSALTTFPISVLFAFAFVTNLGGWTGRFHQATAKRYGLWAWAMTPVAVVAALAALTRVWLFVPSGQWRPEWPLWVGELWTWAAFLFEYSCGVWVQIFLILIVFHWIRGMQLREHKLWEVTMRRFVVVMQWTLPVFLVVSLLTQGPMFLQIFSGDALWAGWVQRIGFGLLAVFLIFFSTVEVTLIFHNETVGDSIKDQIAFLRLHLSAFAWFLAGVAVPLFFVNTFDSWLTLSFGSATLAASLARIGMALPLAGVTAWLLAAWVCFFRAHGLQGADSAGLEKKTSRTRTAKKSKASASAPAPAPEKQGEAS